MDTIEAINGFSPYMGQRKHLSLFINEKRLDEILSERVQKEYLGLIPAWLDEYDPEYAPSMKEKQYVWQQTRLSDKPVVLPILLCPDDFDFSCTVVVVEVVATPKEVTWTRFGVDVTPFDAGETALPKYIGKEVTWFDAVGPYTFSRQAYLACVSQFFEFDIR